MNQKPIAGQSVDVNQLIENEERYRALYENAPIAYQSLNEDGSFRDVNPAWLRTLGYAREEVIGKNFRDFLHPAWQEHFDKNFPYFKKRGYINDVQFKIRHKNGEFRDIIFEGCIGYNADGSFRQTYCVFQDITKRNQSEQELKESQTRFLNLFKSIRDSILVADTNRKIIQCNPAFTDLFGYTESDIKGKETSCIYNDSAGFEEMGAKIKENLGNPNFLLTVQYKKKNGNVFPGETNVFYLKNDSNEIIGFIATIRDVTEREKVNLALKESEERWHFALEGTGDGIWDWDLATNKVFFSDQWKAMLGYQPDEIANELDEWNKRVHPDDLEQALNDINKHFNGETPIYRNEQRLLCKDGTYKWILDRGKILRRDEKGKPLRAIGIHTDISIRKQFENDLIIAKEKAEQNEIKFRQMYENTSIGIGIISLDYKFMGVNQAFCNMLGYTEDEFIGKTLRDITHSDIIDRNLELQKQLEQGLISSFQLEKAFIHKNGHTVYGLVNSTLIRDSHGEPQYFLGNVQDITAIKNAENELIIAKEKSEENEAKFRNFFENSPIGISQTKLDGTIFVNQAFCDMLGYTKEELQQINWRDITYTEDMDVSENILQELNEKRIPKGRFEKRYFHKNGSIVWTDVSVFLQRDIHGEPLYFITAVTDISALKRAEEELKNAHEQLNATLNALPDLLFEIDSNTIIHDYRAPDDSLLYAPPSEFLGKPMKSVLPQAASQKLLFALEEATKNGKCTGVEYTLNFPEGIRWFDLSVSTKHFSGELRYVLLIRDITANKKAEADLKESEEKFRKIFENHSAVKLLVDAETGAIVDANKAATKFYGWTRDELKQMNIFNINTLPSQTGKARMNKVNTIHHTRSEFKHRLKSGEERDVEVYISKINIGGKAYHHAIVHDITERKRFEKDLVIAKEKAEENEKRYKSLFSNMMNAFGLHEMIFNENGEPVDYVFLEVNPVWEKVVGMKAEEVIGKRIKKIMPDIEQSWIDRYGRIVSTGIPVEFIDYNAATQKYYNVFAYKHHGNKFAVVFNDVTDKKQFESELIRAKEKAEENDRLKSAFLANMSHEIRTPMNGILGFINLLSQPDLNDKERNEFIQIINKSGERLMNTINDIVEISRIEVGDIHLNFETFDLAELMQYYSDFFKPQASEKGLTLKISRQVTGEEAWIKTDKHKLDGIFMNLVRNAIKFTDEGKIEIGNYLENGNLYLFVKDTGKGIPKDKQNAIFNRFVQADTELTRGYEGAGIGLSIVKAYVEALNGEIQLHSQPGKGSTFLVSIPYSSVIKTNNNRQFSTVTQEIPQQETLLIADDDEISYYFLEKVLESNYRLLHAWNGEEAIELVKANPEISLVLMDIKMPGKFDGLKATAEIKQINREIPVIVQSAYAMVSDKERAMEAGCDAYISKPYSPGDLNALIRKYCGHNSEKV